MGVLPEIEAAKTETRTLALERPGKPVVRLDAERLARAFADQRLLERLPAWLRRVLLSVNTGYAKAFNAITPKRCDRELTKRGSGLRR